MLGLSFDFEITLNSMMILELSGDIVELTGKLNIFINAFFSCISDRTIFLFLHSSPGSHNISVMIVLTSVLCQLFPFNFVKLCKFLSDLSIFLIRVELFGGSLDKGMGIWDILLTTFL
jgi:hypothetical protein